MSRASALLGKMHEDQGTMHKTLVDAGYQQIKGRDPDFPKARYYRHMNGERVSTYGDGSWTHFNRKGGVTADGVDDAALQTHLTKPSSKYHLYRDD